MSLSRPIPRLLAIALPVATGCVSSSALELYRTGEAACYDRSAEPQTAVVDSHLHFRPFGGPEIPFEELVGYLEETGVLFANVYGIGQMLPASSSCTYYLDCPGTPVTPTLKNDFVNAANVVTKTPDSLHLTLAMTFPDLADPDSILAGMELFDAEYPDVLAGTGVGALRIVGLGRRSRRRSGRSRRPQRRPLREADGRSALRAPSHGRHLGADAVEPHRLRAREGA